MRIPITVYERVLPDDIVGYDLYFGYYTVIDGVAYRQYRVNVPKVIKIEVK